MGQEEPNSKGYKGVLFFEEEDDIDTKNRLISKRGVHINGPYDDDDDDDEDVGDDDIEIETEDFYSDNDDFVETPSRSRRRNSHLI